MKDRYIVVNAILLQDFEQEVTRRLQEGFEPSGTIVLGPKGFYQPMILRGKANEQVRPGGVSERKTA